MIVHIWGFFFFFSRQFVLVSAKTDILEHSEKSESPTSNYDMDVEMSAIYKSENHFMITPTWHECCIRNWMLHVKPLVYKENKHEEGIVSHYMSCILLYKVNQHNILRKYLQIKTLPQLKPSGWQGLTWDEICEFYSPCPPRRERPLSLGIFPSSGGVPMLTPDPQTRAETLGTESWRFTDPAQPRSNTTLKVQSGTRHTALAVWSKWV